MLQGYLGERNLLFVLTAIAFACLGSPCCLLRGWAPPLLPLVISDCISFFNSFRFDLPLFLYGESLGGTISVHITAEQKLKCRGVVLNGPIVKEIAKMKVKKKARMKSEKFLFDNDVRGLDARLKNFIKIEVWLEVRSIIDCCESWFAKLEAKLCGEPQPLHVIPPQTSPLYSTKPQTSTLHA
ncbi:hypothetical protein KSP40_PGU001612 [Platanthera guangdongensis]|uniref:Serine aminopeptidase S33 domain-containing protein n=1 Tax=Platanthera guangdongensis TaxID=2320717 RepID=A0ABR2LBQ2_9ASPA